MRKWLTVLVAILLLNLPALSAVLQNATVPLVYADGKIITATIWNSDVGGIYTYLNNKILAPLNILTTKGDMFAYDGTTLQRIGVGANNTLLCCDSTQLLGIGWKAFAAVSALTTKGDLLTFSTVPARLGVGANDTVLIADSSQATGLKWDTPSAGLSRGMIAPWSPAAAGTSVIPTGWLLCDGTAGTPNLIGLFVLGTKPASSGATAAPTGYGYFAEGAHSTSTTHSHTITMSGSTGATVGNFESLIAGAGSDQYARQAHTHAISATAAANSDSNEVANYTCVYLMKQ